MSKIYMVRHQAHGFLSEYAFGQPPTKEQLDALGRLCFQRHGFSHSKTPDEPYWLQVVEVETLTPESVIDVPDRSLSAVNAAGASQFSVSGVGHVTAGKV